MPEYEVSNFYVPCNVGFFNTLRSVNLLLNVLRLVRILNTTEYRMMMSIRLPPYAEIYTLNMLFELWSV